LKEIGVSEDALTELEGALAAVPDSGPQRGAVQAVVVTGHLDLPKRELLRACGLEPASEWWVTPQPLGQAQPADDGTACIDQSAGKKRSALGWSCPASTQMFAPLMPLAGWQQEARGVGHFTELDEPSAREVVRHGGQQAAADRPASLSYQEVKPTELVGSEANAVTAARDESPATGS
jgi:hypothetical protein